ncbi:MAG: hypothetical protein HRU08_07585, partial [Oleispira sp.]|nr:hypothetical protein [Oleispira sp.]
MKILNLISLIALIISALLLSFPASSTDIDENDFKVIEELFSRANISKEKIKIVGGVDRLEVRLYPSPKLKAFDVDNNILPRSNIYTDVRGRVIYLKIYNSNNSKKLRDIGGISQLDKLE